MVKSEISKLNYKGSIITFQICFLIRKNVFISKDFVYFTDIDNEDYLNYLNEIKYLITIYYNYIL